MNKTYITVFGLIILVALIGVLAIFMMNKKSDVPVTDLADPKNISYLIDGQEITLKDGQAESEAAPGSASKIETKYFGNELVTDLNSDGKDDTVFLLTQSTGGTGTFYYVVAALNTENGYIGSDGYLLGDRIAPQSTEVSRQAGMVNTIVVNYADRLSSEPMTAQPSVGKSVYLKLNPTSRKWGVVEPDFTGEADPARMSLGMKTWTWITTLYTDGHKLQPQKTEAFTVTFNQDGIFNATTDCNNAGGKYVAGTSSISFSEVFSTEMYCDDSQEADFISLLGNTGTYHFTAKGELVLNHATATATFR